METKKHIINLPENKVAENISVKTENGQIVVNYDLKEKFDFKEGEIYFVETLDGNNVLYIHKSVVYNKIFCYVLFFLENTHIYFNDLDWIMGVPDIVFIRPATSKEKKTLFNALAKEGKQWNEEKMCIEDIFDPKDGDFLIKSGFVFIYKNPIDPCFYRDVCGCYCSQAESTLNVDKCSFWTYFEGCRYATESEKQAFLNELENYGYIWNAEKKCLEEYVWKPEKGEEYFFLGIDLKVYSNTYYDTYIDSSLISIGNCFQTKKQAGKKAEELKEVLKKK